MKPQHVITVQSLSKHFVLRHDAPRTVREHLFGFWKRRRAETFHALSDLSFVVQQGEFFGIIGRNGSGKSTLLKTIAGIYQPTSGLVQSEGLISPFLELGVGFNPELSARANVYLNGALLGLSQQQIAERFDAIIAFAELEEFVDTPLKKFSSGMQLRLAFSVAIQVDADILLLDEVLAVGDANFQQKCFEMFRQFKKDGKTIVFVSHDLSSMRQFCNRVLYLKDGKAQMIGDPNDVIDHYLYEDRLEQLSQESLPQRSLQEQKPVEITQVEFVDKFGNPNKTYLSGDQFLIRVHYKKHAQQVEKPVLGIAVYRDDGTHIYGTNTNLQGIELQLKNEGVIELSNQQLPLIQGAFDVTLAFHHQDGTVYDWRDKAWRFSVQKAGRQDGMVELDFRYKY